MVTRLGKAFASLIPGGKSKKPNKYFAKPQRVDGEFFHSTGEFKHWCDLQMRQRAKEISGLRRQIKYSLDVNGLHVCDYIADFAYFDYTKGPIVADYKHAKTLTAEARLKLKLMKACHGIDVELCGPIAWQGRKP